MRYEIKNYIWAIILGTLLFSPVAAAKDYGDLMFAVQSKIWNKCNELLVDRIGPHVLNLEGHNGFKQISDTVGVYYVKKTKGTTGVTCVLHFDFEKKKYVHGEIF